MDLFTSIRDTLSFILSNYRFDGSSSSSPISSAIELAQKLLSQMDGKEKCIERLYLFYYLSEIVEHMTHPNESQLFINTLFASPLNQRQANLMSQLISLALSLRNEELLNCTAKYLMDCDHISLPNDITLPQSLAQDSPQFCAAFISKGYFVGNNISKKQLTQWLNTLINLIDNQLILNSSIRFSFLDGVIDSDLHLAILSVIQQRKCQPLSNQFIIDLATVISQRTNNEELVDRFAQIIIIASSSSMCSQSNQVKNILLSKFPNNKLINAVCK
jgi:hypothetical protein